MKTIELVGELRRDLGKKSSKQIRKNERIPCVLYGQNEPVHFSTVDKELGLLVYTQFVYLVNLSIDGKKYLALLKDLQFHPVSDKIIHADFYEINEEVPVIIKIPVQLDGFAKGVQAGGKLKAEMRRVAVKGLIKDFPEHLNIDVTDLGLGHSIKVRDLKFERLQLLDPKNAVVASVKLTRAAKGAAAGTSEEAEVLSEETEESKSSEE